MATWVLPLQRTCASSGRCLSKKERSTLPSLYRVPLRLQGQGAGGSVGQVQRKEQPGPVGLLLLQGGRCMGQSTGHAVPKVQAEAPCTLRAHAQLDVHH
jgi:hypothetical protein